MDVNKRPEGYHSVTPYLFIDGAAAAIDFYTKAFGAKELFRLPMDNKIGHAEIMIGDSHVMLADENAERDIRGPKSRGGTTVSLMLYVPDVDATFARAVAAGATVRRPVTDQFYGDRVGTLTDPFGHVWSIATHREDVSIDEAKRRMAALMQEQTPK